MLTLAATVPAAALFAVAWVVISEGLRFAAATPLSDLLGGAAWAPAANPPSLGIRASIGATVAVGAGALALAAPIGVAAAVTLSEVVPSYVRAVMRPAIEGLSALPAVVVGWVGIVLIRPATSALLGDGALASGAAAACVLALMAIPTIAALSQEALAAVPARLREASLALGADAWETTWRVAVPHAWPRFASAILIAAGRILGEGIAVVVVAGASLSMPSDPTRPDMLPDAARTLAGSIAECAALVGGGREGAVFLAGATLLAMTLAARSLGARLAARASTRGAS